MNGYRMHGCMMNGYRMHGCRVHGYRMHGYRMHGCRVHGYRMHGYRMHRSHVNMLMVDNMMLRVNCPMRYRMHGHVDWPDFEVSSVNMKVETIIGMCCSSVMVSKELLMMADGMMICTD